jgi:hypothetical protein
MSDDEPEMSSMKCDRCGEEIPSGEFRTTDGVTNYHLECHSDALAHTDPAAAPGDEAGTAEESTA